MKRYQQRSVWAGAFFALLAAQAAFAAPVLYDCVFDQSRSRGGGWVPERLYLIYDADVGSIEVIDPVIKHFVGSPIKGGLIGETAKRIGFKWSLVTKDSASQSVTMDYRMTYYKNGQPTQMTVQPGGFDNSWSGSGSCKIGKP